MSRTFRIKGGFAVRTRVSALQICGSAYGFSTDTTEDRRFVQTVVRQPNGTVIFHGLVAFEARVVDVATGESDGDDIPVAVIMSTSGCRSDVNAPHGNGVAIVCGGRVGGKARRGGHETLRSMFVIEHRDVV